MNMKHVYGSTMIHGINEANIPLLMERGEWYYIYGPGPRWIFDFAFV
jgi:hypothetical protein